MNLRKEIWHVRREAAWPLLRIRKHTHACTHTPPHRSWETQTVPWLVMNLTLVLPNISSELTVCCDLHAWWWILVVIWIVIIFIPFIDKMLKTKHLSVLARLAVYLHTLFRQPSLVGSESALFLCRSCTSGLHVKKRSDRRLSQAKEAWQSCFCP